MDFAFDNTTLALRERLLAFMHDHVYPSEERFQREVRQAADPWSTPAGDRGAQARGARAGAVEPVPPAPAAWRRAHQPPVRAAGRGHGPQPMLGPEVFNCPAPDTGNMEVLADCSARRSSRSSWLSPLIEGEIRSAFCDDRARRGHLRRPQHQLAHRARRRRVRDQRRASGSTSGACPRRCELCILIGVTDPDAGPSPAQCMILVPLDTPGRRGRAGDAACSATRRPTAATREIPSTKSAYRRRTCSGEGDGFGIAQEPARPGPHPPLRCERSAWPSGRSRRCASGSRAARRSARASPTRASSGNGSPTLAIEIEQARLLGLKAAWVMDTFGNKGARRDVGDQGRRRRRSRLGVLDRAIQAHGAAGLSQDYRARRAVRAGAHVALRRRPRRGPPAVDRPARGPRARGCTNDDRQRCARFS